MIFMDKEEFEKIVEEIKHLKADAEIHSKQKRELKGQVKALKVEKERLKDLATDRKIKIGIWQGHVKAQEATIDDLQIQVNDLRAALKDKNQQIENMQAKTTQQSIPKEDCEVCGNNQLRIVVSAGMRYAYRCSRCETTGRKRATKTAAILEWNKLMKAVGAHHD